MIDIDLIRKHKKRIANLLEATVKSHTRTSKTGKVFNVKQHDRREDSIKDEIKQVKSDIAKSDTQILSAANAGGRIPQSEGGEPDRHFVANYRMDREGRLKELRSRLRTIRKERAAENKEYGYTIGDQSIKFGAKSKLDKLKKTINAGSDRDNAYINALLTPYQNKDKELAKFKNQARGGNIDRTLERVAAGQMTLSDDVIKKLKAARKAIKD